MSWNRDEVFTPYSRIPPIGSKASNFKNFKTESRACEGSTDEAEALDSDSRKLPAKETVKTPDKLIRRKTYIVLEPLVLKKEAKCTNLKLAAFQFEIPHENSNLVARHVLSTSLHLVMAIGVFKLSQTQRQLLSIIFLILNMIQVLTGVIMLSLSAYVYVSVAPVLYSDRAELCYIFAVVAFCGFNNICCWLFGLKIRLKCLNQSYKKSTRSLIFAWTCVGFYIIAYLFVLAKLTRKVYKHVVRSMGHSFYIGMRKYLHDEIWKITIDKIQYELECCGSHGYKEWYEVPWLGQYQVNHKSETVKQFHGNETWLFPAVPWSCCRVGFPMQCLHDPLQQIRSHDVWADQHSIAEDSLNTDGCISKLKVPIRWSLTAFILLVVINCLVQLVIFAVLRILYTSCRNNQILNDPDGIAPGWIFGRGDCGYSRGKTLGDIMYPTPVIRRKSATRIEEEQTEFIVD